LLRPADALIAAPALGAVILSFFVAYSGGGRPVANLRGDGGHWVFPLDSTETIALEGPLGATEIEIRGGEARVLSSPCRDLVCVAAGAIRSRGQWAACLPNRVILYISAPGGAADGVDATAR